MISMGGDKVDKDNSSKQPGENPAEAVPEGLEASVDKKRNTTPTVNPDFDLVNRTLP